MQETIDTLARQVIDNTELRIVEVSVKHAADHDIIQVFLDSERGITIGECQSVARRLSDLLDSDSRFQRPFTLEVSSPGIDRPISEEWQFRKNIGRLVSIEFANESGEMQTIKGKIERADPRTVIVAVRKKKELDLISIPLVKIKLAKIRLN